MQVVVFVLDFIYTNIFCSPNEVEVKIFLESYSKPISGRQVVLYHVNPDDDCVLTTSCLFAGNRYPVEGITESRVTSQRAFISY